MPSNIPATTIRIDPEVKREAAAILDELGLSMSTAVNAFLRALVREGGMPFEMRVRTPALVSTRALNEAPTQVGAFFHIGTQGQRRHHDPPGRQDRKKLRRARPL